MKYVLISQLALLGVEVSAFIGRAALPKNSQLCMSTVEELPDTYNIGKKNKHLSKFDKHKDKYKGNVNAFRLEDDIDVPFDYTAFDEEVQGMTYSFEQNEIISGRVIEVERKRAIIDCGSKANAFLSLREASLIPIDDLTKKIQPDETYEFKVISEEDENGQFQVSLRRIEFINAWNKVQALQVEDETFEGEVVGVNRGGAMVYVEGLRGFLPGSHLMNRMPTEDLIGEKLPLKFLQVSPEENKLIVSHKRAVVETQMQTISRGDVVTGKVVVVKPYGAFVDIGGMSGLLHISQISYDRILSIDGVLQVGQELKCMIIDHDKVNGRIAMSTKTLEPEPGDMIKNPQKVYDLADETAAKYHERMEAERRQREEAAKDIVMGLGEGLASELDAVVGRVEDAVGGSSSD